jgi:glutamine synthetase
LRAVIASAANDHRLGANEAPPAILSVYLGDQLEKVFKDIQDGAFQPSQGGGLMDLGLSQILSFTRDPGDRNRTSPFAFTGNRFEFRAVGSSQSVSGPLVAMNTVLADSLNWIAEKLEASLAGGADKPTAVLDVLKVLMDEHGQVIFGGDGYSSEWHKEAVEKRGLKNLPTSADALPAFLEDSVKTLFSSTGVLSPVELASRYEVYSEQYVLSIEVEAKLVIDMATTSIYPAAASYLAELGAAASASNTFGIAFGSDIAKEVAANVEGMLSKVTVLKGAIEKHDFDSVEDHLKYCANDLLPLMNEVRAYADSLEQCVADSAWPLPKYSEMLFIK